MARLSKIIKGHRYQVGRFAGKWYVADLDRNKFIYGPFARRQTAEARIKRLPKRINPVGSPHVIRYAVRTNTKRTWSFSVWEVLSNETWGKKVRDGLTKIEAKRLATALNSSIDPNASINPSWVTPRKAKKLGAMYRRTFARFERENPKRRKNPARGTLIYGRVLKIFAQKTEGPYKGQRFVHTFKKGAIMVGMPDGSLRITHP